MEGVGGGGGGDGGGPRTVEKRENIASTDENINGIRGTSRFLRGFFLIW